MAALMLDPNAVGIGVFGYLFVHGSWMHLIGNMVFLFALGNAVNARIGHAAYAALYLGSGALAGLAWLAFGADALGLIGASGAVMGVAGAFLVLYPLNQVSVFYFILIRFGTFSVPGRVVIVVYVLLDMVGYALGGDVVAYAAHLGGVFVGAAAVALLFRSGVLKPVDGEVNALQMFRGEDGRRQRQRGLGVGEHRMSEPVFWRHHGREPDEPLPPIDVDFDLWADDKAA
jgi:membrane associated rhomboid family serine protease